MRDAANYIKAAQLEQRVANEAKPLLVCFTRKNFAPAERLLGALSALPAEWEQKLTRVCIDVDEDPERMDALRVFKIPEMMLYASGRIVERSEGEQDLESLQAWLNYTLSRIQ